MTGQINRLSNQYQHDSRLAHASGLGYDGYHTFSPRTEYSRKLNIDQWIPLVIADFDGALGVGLTEQPLQRHAYSRSNEASPHDTYCNQGQGPSFNRQMMETGKGTSSFSGHYSNGHASAYTRNGPAGYNGAVSFPGPTQAMDPNNMFDVQGYHTSQMQFPNSSMQMLSTHGTDQSVEQYNLNDVHPSDATCTALLSSQNELPNPDNDALAYWQKTVEHLKKLDNNENSTADAATAKASSKVSRDEENEF